MIFLEGSTPYFNLQKYIQSVHIYQETLEQLSELQEHFHSYLNRLLSYGDEQLVTFLTLELFNELLYSNQIEEEKIFKEEQTINTENENSIKNEICEEENYDENESFEVLPKNKTFQFYGATFKVKNEEIFIKKFNPHAKVFISATNKITEVTEINTKKIVKISEFDNIVVLARRQKNRDIKGTKIVIVDGEIQCEEEIYTFLNEIYLSKMLPEELQNEAKKLMIN